MGAVDRNRLGKEPWGRWEYSQEWVYSTVGQERVLYREGNVCGKCPVGILGGMVQAGGRAGAKVLRQERACLPCSTNSGKASDQSEVNQGRMSRKRNWARQVVKGLAGPCKDLSFYLKIQGAI